MSFRGNLSLAAPEIVKMSTSYVTSDENILKIITLKDIHISVLDK